MTLEQYTTLATRSVAHRTTELPVDWLDFCTHLQDRLGRYNEKSLNAATNMLEFQAAVDNMRKAEPFSIYASYDHGHLLNLVDGRPPKAKQYVIGNSVFATTMTRHDRREGWTTIEFEVAASMIGALSEGNREAIAAAEKIDELREAVFAKIFEDVKAGRKGGNGL
ncbi:hypothetical protein LTR56_008360 [Elasticomyces elasticus]|nr:hypothetical protein LTR56_008360 [Elasticomyces elasticus]KAK3661496.1 hypothetical protein LTR22_007506 [Elasticomyces elasticus]KAK4926146.1 hypothetical protein LTR49_006850 [Elasticomyces elasticus]KAK5756917.1 hypothetical protein LTS12_012996 [Elasticomyces elasticus]